MSYTRYNPSVVALTGVPLTSSGYTNITRQLMSSPTRTVQAQCGNIPTNTTVTINWYGSNTAPQVNIITPQVSATATTGGVLMATTVLGGSVWTAGQDSSGAAITAANWAYIYCSVSVSSGTVTDLTLTVGV